MLNRQLLGALVALGLASSAAVAAVPGFYVGGKAGQANTHYTTSTGGLTSTTGLSSKGMSGAVLGGYQFDQNWALELGYHALPDATFNGMNGTATNGTLTQNSWSFMAKGIVPFESGFEGYAKLGLARTSASPDANLAARSTLFPRKQTATSLAYGVGVGYDVNCNLSVDASWQRVASKNSIRNSDMLAVGFTFHFG